MSPEAIAITAGFVAMLCFVAGCAMYRQWDEAVKKAREADRAKASAERNAEMLRAQRDDLAQCNASLVATNATLFRTCVQLRSRLAEQRIPFAPGAVEVN